MEMNESFESMITTMEKMEAVTREHGSEVVVKAGLNQDPETLIGTDEIVEMTKKEIRSENCRLKESTGKDPETSIGTEEFVDMTKELRGEDSRLKVKESTANIVQDATEDKEPEGSDHGDDCNNENPMKPKQNPLLIPEIVSHIINCSGFIPKDLKSIQSVCGCWRNQSFKMWREVAKIVVVADGKTSKLPGFNCVNRKVKGVGYQELLKLLRNAKMVNGEDPLKLLTNPFVHYEFKDSQLTFPASYNCQMSEYFQVRYSLLQEQGPIMKSLCLDNMYFLSGYFIEGWKTLLMDTCNRLEELVIVSSRVEHELVDLSSSDDEDGTIKQSDSLRKWRRKQFKGAFNLKSLTFTGCGGCYDDDPVRNFWESFYETEPDLVHFSKIVPNLKDLTLDLSSLGLIGLLQHPNTWSQYPVNADEFIKLEKLHLNLKDKDGKDRSTAPYPNLNLLIEYLDMVKPPLKDLSISFAWSRLSEGDRLENVVKHCNDTLTRLKLEIIRPESSTKSWYRSYFSGLNRFHYPKLTHLILELSGELLQFDFSTLKNMRELKVFSLTGTNNSCRIFESQQILLSAKRMTASTNHVFQIEDVSPEKRVQLNKMEEFRYFFHDKFTVCGMKLLATWIPKLKILEAVLDDDTLTMAMESWPTLEKVILLFGSTVEPEIISKVEAANKNLLIERV